MAELDSTVSRISRRLDTLFNDDKCLNQSVQKGGLYWKGISFEAFKDSYAEYTQQSGKGQNQLKQIKSQLYSLQQAIQRAEEEKRRQEALRRQQRK
ncbi:WXG100 family type VII secretion target [Cellulosilyticum lentocellum]|uniref:WXG100 family type VII secretion target n=1 Tax=Cellulosilyticum lentocellum (strain ATCC 49066 / DSM 5427 / NCIMB 11756 / RHM5) TaxID=642492 RepID=F2JHU3_CELLD|nr:WXG100 family type VII secretion target [Cellulosilyticum lentocellum]ADZ85435.1 hypothetical protein Clole_3755 [Cellulosilyticum lentocellum DSM 5427]